MKSVQLIAMAGALACALGSTSANATAIVVNQDMTLAQIGFFNGVALSPGFTAGVGDTVTFNVNFTDGPVVLTNDTALWLLAFANGDAGLKLSSEWTFINPSANMIGSVSVPDESALYVHIGSYIGSSQYRLDSAPISFTGISLTMNILGVFDIDPNNTGTPVPSVDPRDYYRMVFDPQLSVAPPVPEPASWAMMIGGFALLGGALRRRSVAIRYA